MRRGFRWAMRFLRRLKTLARQGGVRRRELLTACRKGPKLDVERQDKARLVSGARIDPSVEGNVSQCAHEDDLHP